MLVRVSGWVREDHIGTAASDYSALWWEVTAVSNEVLCWLGLPAWLGMDLMWYGDAV